MTTVNIRKALALIDLDHPNDPDEAGALVAQALVDLVAIERLARFIASADLDKPESARDAVAVMETALSIAKDAP